MRCVSAEGIRVGEAPSSRLSKTGQRGADPSIDVANPETPAWIAGLVGGALFGAVVGAVAGSYFGLEWQWGGAAGAAAGAIIGPMFHRSDV